MSNRHPKTELTSLIIRYQQSIYGYIYSLIPNRAVAEDILQETFLTVVERFDSFEPGTNFLAWARTIAFWKVRQAKASYLRSKVVFSESLINALHENQVEISSVAEHRHEALDRCLGKLKERDRILILKRYSRGKGVEDAARETGRSLQAAYKALARLRRRLVDCVDKELMNEGAYR